ncbi:MAG: ribosome maturation factor [Chitinophagales bacterium]|nr:ribosome maturation factor [Chitinophagales bacterium]MDW8427792.1 ribosome maturation factor [Chitinophagales bacterium]
MNEEQRIRAIVNELLDQTDAYLVDLKIRTGKVQVFVDRDPYITLEDCARINRMLVRRLDEELAFTDRYALEVSSPGLDQPLKVLRQYRKNIGRIVEVITVTGEKKRGLLLYVDEEKLVIEETELVNKQKTIRHSALPFLHIKSTNVVIEF